jgi:hypothetical protein
MVGFTAQRAFNHALQGWHEYPEGFPAIIRAIREIRGELSRRFRVAVAQTKVSGPRLAITVKPSRPMKAKVPKTDRNHKAALVSVERLTAQNKSKISEVMNRERPLKASEPKECIILLGPRVDLLMTLWVTLLKA